MGTIRTPIGLMIRYCKEALGQFDCQAGRMRRT
jgi:hypothetical protein